MRFVRKKEGFTLMELLIVILTGSIVTMAATTVLLLAFRINHKSLDTIKRQSVTRIMLSVLEDMSSDGEYVMVNNATQNPDGSLTPVTEIGGNAQDFWSINKENEANPALITPLITYTPPMGGASGKIVGNGGQTLVDDITSSKLYKTYSPFDYVKDLYTFSVEIEGKTYGSTVYSRTQEDNWYANDPLIDYEEGRNILVSIAASQVGSSGKIIDMSEGRLGGYYSEWYATQIGQSFNEESTNPFEWSRNTPWCAAFVSWAINQCTDVEVDIDTTVTYLDGEPPRQANVNYLWVDSFARMGWDKLRVYSEEPSYVPRPGDIVFFTDVSEHGDNENLYALRNLNTAFNLIGENRTLTEVLQDEIRKEGLGLYIHEDHVVGQPTSNLCFRTEPTADYVKYSVLRHFIGATGDGLDHVGIIVKVEKEIVNGVETTFIYTVEGNMPTGGSTMAVIKKRPLINADVPENTFLEEGEMYHIFGYATLNWAGNP